MQLSEWDQEFQNNVKAIETLSKKILYTDHKLKSHLIKKKFILFKEQRKAVRIFAKNEELNYLSPKLSNIQKVIIYWIKEVSKSTQLFFEKSCTHNIYDMWLKLFHCKLSGESNEKLNLMNLATRKISLDEEYRELEQSVAKIDKEHIKLKNKKEYWQLAKSNQEAMSNLDFNMKENKVNTVISNTVKSMISDLYNEHDFLIEKRKMIKKHKSLSQNLMYYCKRSSFLLSFLLFSI